MSLSNVSLITVKYQIWKKPGSCFGPGGAGTLRPWSGETKILNINRPQTQLDKLLKIKAYRAINTITRNAKLVSIGVHAWHNVNARVVDHSWEIVIFPVINAKYLNQVKQRLATNNLENQIRKRWNNYQTTHSRKQKTNIQEVEAIKYKQNKMHNVTRSSNINKVLNSKKTSFPCMLPTYLTSGSPSSWTVGLSEIIITQRSRPCTLFPIEYRWVRFGNLNAVS